MTDYLPAWATAQEAAEWLHDATGEAWPLPRLLESCTAVGVWLDPAPDTPETVLEGLFQGRREGFMAPVVFGTDTARMAIVRDGGTLSFTRRPDGELVRLDPPVPFAAAELRFAAASVRAAAEPAAAVARGTEKAWTPERLEKLRAYRKEHGTKQAADWAGISPARVRALLPGDKPLPKGYGVFNQR